MKYRKNHLFIIEHIIILLLSIVAGYNLIYETTDSVIYREHYSSISYYNPLGDEIYFELLYKIAASLGVLLLHIPYEAFASLLAFISLQIKFYLFSQRAYSLYLKIAYILTLYPFYESLRMRAALAIALVYLALELRNKKSLSLFCLLLGIFFHYSLMPFLLIWLIYYHIDDIKKTRRIIKILFLAFAILFINFQAIDIGIFDFIDFRILAYFLGDEGYINIWSFPKFFLLSWITYLFLKEQLSPLHTVLFFTASIFLMFSVLVYKINIISLSLLDIGIFSYYLIATNQKLKSHSIIGLLFFSTVMMEFLFRILQLPVLLIALLK